MEDKALLCRTKIMRLMSYLRLKFKLILYVEECLLVCTENIFSSVKDNNYAMKFWEDSKWKWDEGRVIWEKKRISSLNKITCRSSRPEVFLVKRTLKICNKFTGEHPCRSVISIKLQSNFIELTLRYGCSPLNLLHTFKTPFTKNSYGGLLLNLDFKLWSFNMNVNLA